MLGLHISWIGLDWVGLDWIGLDERPVNNPSIHKPRQTLLSLCLTDERKDGWFVLFHFILILSTPLCSVPSQAACFHFCSVHFFFLLISLSICLCSVPFDFVGSDRSSFNQHNLSQKFYATLRIICSDRTGNISIFTQPNAIVSQNVGNDASETCVGI